MIHLIVATGSFIETIKTYLYDLGDGSGLNARILNLAEQLIDNSVC